jgi:hypothetical protein
MPTKTEGEEPSQKELQRKIGKTRDSLRSTVEAIQDKAEQQYQTVKETVSGVLDYRDEFQKEPVVWSLGALSAGFALGYTVGYSHKIAKTSKHSQFAKFTDSVVDELSQVGQRFVLPELNTKIRQLFGFDFASLLSQARGKPERTRTKRPKNRRSTKAPQKSGQAKRRASTSPS